MELLSDHPRPSSAEAPLYRGCPCRDPPVCHRVILQKISSSFCYLLYAVSQSFLFAQMCICFFLGRMINFECCRVCPWISLKSSQLRVSRRRHCNGHLRLSSECRAPKELFDPWLCTSLSAGFASVWWSFPALLLSQARLMSARDSATSCLAAARLSLRGLHRCIRRLSCGLLEVGLRYVLAIGACLWTCRVTAVFCATLISSRNSSTSHRQEFSRMSAFHLGNSLL